MAASDHVYDRNGTSWYVAVSARNSPLHSSDLSVQLSRVETYRSRNPAPSMHSRPPFPRSLPTFLARSAARHTRSHRTALTPVETIRRQRGSNIHYRDYGSEWSYRMEFLIDASSSKSACCLEAKMAMISSQLLCPRKARPRISNRSRPNETTPQAGVDELHLRLVTLRHGIRLCPQLSA